MQDPSKLDLKPNLELSENQEYLVEKKQSAAWQAILDLNLGKLAEKRKSKMAKFAQKSNFKMVADAFKVESLIKELKRLEADRL